jgi:hypothetical protein
MLIRLWFRRLTEAITVSNVIEATAGLGKVIQASAGIIKERTAVGCSISLQTMHILKSTDCVVYHSESLGIFNVLHRPVMCKLRTSV